MRKTDGFEILKLLKLVHPDPAGMGEEDLKERLGWTEERYEIALTFLRKKGLIKEGEGLVFDFEDPDHKPIPYRWIRITRSGNDALEQR
ncbi:MAG: hypothetical protein JSW01_02975 [Candidatus Bathyarchaeota archaeon]|nr:MAG: hypothetical protein JSW01_02975 [Candidatus Bathyarchaeota archaeon]